MTEEKLSTELKWANTAQNIAGEPTPVTTWDVPEGTEVEIRQGHPAVLEADKVGGGNMPRSTKLGFAYREPNDPLGAYTVISEFSVAPFNSLSLRDQQSGDNAERRRVRFIPERVPGGRIVLSDSDDFALLALSGEQIDASSLFFNYPVEIRQA